MKLNEAVQLYIRMRDKKADMQKDFNARLAEIQSDMDKLEAKLLKAFQTVGVESVRTEFGTAYTSVRTSVTTADRDAFFNFVKDREEWGLLEVRPAKTAVEEFRAANDNELPPGINYSAERVVNIRRSA